MAAHMIKLNHRFLVELGLGRLDKREEDVINRRIYEVLEMRVGMALFNSLTKSQQDTFERELDEGPEEAQAYLARTVPNYASAVRTELEVIATAIAEGVRQGAVAGEPAGVDQSDDE